MLILFKKIADFFLFTSLYIAAGAALMAYQTFLLFHYPVQPFLIWFIFFGTVCSYNFHWVLTPALAGGSAKTKWSYQHRYLHIILFGVGLTCAAFFSLQLMYHWYWLLLTALVTFLYSAPKIPWKPFQFLKKIAVGKTVFLALAWTHIPFILPLVFSTVKWTIAEYLFVFNRFYLIYAICILFDYRDRESDRSEGIRSMITYLSNKGIDTLFWGSLTLFLCSGIGLIFYRQTFVQTGCILVPGLILTLIYPHAKNTSSDYYYYFILDGLMMLSSLLLWAV